MHLDDERIQRLLHDELAVAEAETVAHLSQCAACRERVEAARAEEARIFALLSRVDHPAQVVDPRRLFAGAPRSGVRWSRRAAAVLASAAVAGVAYAAPGSPLPAALSRLLGGHPQGRPPATAADSDSVAPAGIAVAPGEALVIRLLTSRGEAAGTIALTEDEEVVVRAPAGAVTFTSDPGGLIIQSSGPTLLEILIPRTAPSVEVLADTTVVFRTRSTGIETRLPRDSTGRWTISLLSPSP